MDHFTNCFRMSLLVAGLAIGEAWLSDKPLAGEPLGGSEAACEPANHPREQKWGSVRVRFVFDGPQEKAEAAWATHAAPQAAVDDESLVIHPASRGIRNVVAAVRHVTRVHEMYAHDRDTPVVLVQHNNRFQPHILPVMVGQPLEIRNRDATVHIGLIRPQRSQEMDVLLAPGEEATWRFAHAEFPPVAVGCTFNPWMRAYVLISDNPYVGVSDEYGLVKLVNVPFGEELELRLWHERSGTLVPFHGDLRVLVPEDGTLDLGEIRIPAAALAPPLGFTHANGVNP